MAHVNAKGLARLSAEGSSLSPFQLGVLRLTCAVPPGRVTTYRAIGAALKDCSGGGMISQAVGNALKRNPLAPEVPCHRVVRGGSSYTLGGFAGAGPDSGSPELLRKRALLSSEGVFFSDGSMRIVDETRVMSKDEFDPRDVAAARLLAAGAAAKEGQSQSKYFADEQPPQKRRREGAGASAAAAPKPSVAESRALLSAAGTSGLAVRSACRQGFDAHTSGLAPSVAQANLVILPREHAFDFLLFCTRNPQSCPLLAVTEEGPLGPVLPAGSVAPGADVRSDLPRYRIWKRGVPIAEPTNIVHLWPAAAAASPSASAASPPTPASDARSDWVAFLLGCSFSFEDALLAAKLPVRHLQQPRIGDADLKSCAALAAAGKTVADPRNVPMYRTRVKNIPAGRFGGSLVVSMRPMTPLQALRAKEITAAFPRVHGAPVHIGDPAALGIADLSKPDFGDAVTVFPGEVPVFWACGVTPQAALAEAKLQIAITHAPGHMLVLDVSNEALKGALTVDISTSR